jgi:hypothetical protein
MKLVGAWHCRTLHGSKLFVYKSLTTRDNRSVATDLGYNLQRILGELLFF